MKTRSTVLVILATWLSFLAVAPPVIAVPNCSESQVARGERITEVCSCRGWVIQAECRSACCFRSNMSALIQGMCLDVCDRLNDQLIQPEVQRSDEGIVRLVPKVSCDRGKVIWNAGAHMGCLFEQWGTAENELCKSVVSFKPMAIKQPDPTFGKCWVCIEEDYASWITERHHWPKLKVGVNEASGTQADFSCLGTPQVVELQPRTPIRQLPFDFQLADREPSGSETCKWTSWLNRDTPGGSGDYETLSDFVAAGQACERPRKVECRARDGRSLAETGEIVTCSETAGAVCVNRQQPSGRCSDYEVRFCCD